MTSPPRARAFEYGPELLLVLFALPVLVYGMASHGVNTPDEAYYHGVAEHMAASGDWLHIVFRGTHRPFDAFMNAPLQYWSRAALISAFGSSYWTMRALSAFFAIASLLITVRGVRSLADRPTALIAGLVQLTTFQLIYMHSGRTGVLEPVVTFLVTLAAFSFIRILKTGRGFLLHHACLVLLLNVKAPTVVLPMLAELACFALIPSTRIHLRRWLVLGLMAAPIGLLWHAVNAVMLWEHLPGVLERMGRQAGEAGREGFFARRGSNLVYYVTALLFGAFPYSLLYPSAMAAALRADASVESSKLDGWRVLGLYVAAIAVFFVFIDKRYHWYLIPAIPFLSAFVAHWLRGLARRPPTRLAIATLATAAGAVIAIDVSVRDLNPFDPVFDLYVASSGGGSMLVVRSWLLFAAVGIGTSIVLWLVASRVGARAARPIAWAATLVLLGLGAARVLGPLDKVDFVTPAESLRREVDVARETGQELVYPLRVPRGRANAWGSRFYFADEFRLVQDGAGYLIYPREPASGSAP